jgi:hypothetical protein
VGTDTDGLPSACDDRVGSVRVPRDGGQPSAGPSGIRVELARKQSHVLGLAAAVLAGTLLAVGAPVVSANPGPAAVASATSERPFAGIRYFYLPASRTWRAVKFSSRVPGYAAGRSVATYSSQGAPTDYCFFGQRSGSVYVGELDRVRVRDQRFTTIREEARTFGQLLVGRPSSSAPGWFRKRARPVLNGSNSCSVT